MKEILLNLITNPYLYLIGALLILFISKPSLSYVNIGEIVRLYYIDVLMKNRLIKLFIVIPVLLSQAINLVKMIDESINQSISVSISILISMFFAYMAFYSDYKPIITNDASKTQILKLISKESKTIVSYQIFYV